MTRDPGASRLTPTNAVSEPLLRLVSVGHGHGGGPWLFRGLNLSVQPGERLAIQGASGCGKSTLLQIMAGLEVPTEGEVYWGQQAMSGWNDAQRRACRQSQMGFVFQAFHLLPHLSALQNVMVPCLLGGQSAQVAEARATELLETLGLVHRLEAKPATLSGVSSNVWHWPGRWCMGRPLCLPMSPREISMRRLRPMHSTVSWTCARTNRPAL